MKEATHKRLPNIWFYLYQILEKAKLGLKGEIVIGLGTTLTGGESTIDKHYEKTSRAMKMFYVKTVLVVTLVATLSKLIKLYT